MGTILIIVLVLLLVGALPTWSHSSNWGYFPSGGLGLVVVVLLVLVLTGTLLRAQRVGGSRAIPASVIGRRRRRGLGRTVVRNGTDIAGPRS